MPSRETIWFVPLIVVFLVIAMCLTIFLSPAIGIPLLVLAGIFGAVGWFGGRSGSTGSMTEFREQADGGVDFTPADRQTLTPTESEPR